MWDKIKGWYQRNKSYLAMLFIASLGVGLVTAGICIFFPAALTAFASVTLLGLAPLAFLNTLPFGLAVFALSSIMTGISFGAIAAGIIVMQQLSTIGAHIYELFKEEKAQDNETLYESSHDYLNRHLQPERSRSIDYLDDEFEISSDDAAPAAVSQPSILAMHNNETEPTVTMGVNP